MAAVWSSATVLLIVATCATCAGSACALMEEEKQATFLTAAVGEYVVFNCQLDFPHDIVIPHILRWNKDGRAVFSWYDGVLTADPGYLGRVSLVSPDAPYGRGSVNLTSIRETDSGWYECVVFFPNRTPATRPNGTWFHLAVEGGTLLTIPPINQTVMEGEPAHFPCVTKESNSTVTWLRDGVPLTDLRGLAGRVRVSEDGSLTITRTDMADPGEYVCVVTNAHGHRHTAGAFLDVHYKAKVVYAAREIFLPYGRPAVLDCHFRANPPLTNLRWEKDGFLFDPFNVQGVFSRRNGSLYFSKVDESHGGRYTCTPTNELGSEGPSPPMMVIVQRPPVFTVRPHNLYLRRAGDSVVMPCDAIDGDEAHRPTIVWFRKDGSPLPVERITLHNGNLTIENIKESDRGLYQCVASNEAATISVDTELMIENVAPRAPYNLSATSDETSVTLRWVPGFTRPPMDYSIWYRPADTPEWRTMKLASRTSTEATVRDLGPGRTYEFMVLSQDSYGDGMFSKMLQVRTKGSPVHNSSAQELGSFQQIGPPHNVTVQLTDDGYMVSWEPPLFGSEDLKSYTVRWTEGPRQQLYGRADTTDTFFVVPHLEEGATYQFEVSARSHNEYLATSPRVEVRVPSQQQQLRAVALGVAASALLVAAAAAAAWYLRRLHLRRSAVLSNSRLKGVPHC
ncbi:protein borderless [Schistocerca piceifrons]|uniref:protein borderless n=1 Tax=Schistocerca piceifrons TaxID=274613 RepID=UPI001F5F798A|nr:protein borderless [Schistocerca piceifrons]